MHFLSNCNDNGVGCNECLDLTTKTLRYVDEQGNNLLFGNQAIYNPKEVIISDSSGGFIHISIQEEDGALAFELFDNTITYQIVLSSSITDNLQFELDERKSKSCCGNVTISTKTTLNSEEIENNDAIVIVKN